MSIWLPATGFACQPLVSRPFSIDHTQYQCICNYFASFSRSFHGCGHRDKRLHCQFELQRLCDLVFDADEQQPRLTKQRRRPAYATFPMRDTCKHTRKRLRGREIAVSLCDHTSGVFDVIWLLFALACGCVIGSVSPRWWVKDGPLTYSWDATDHIQIGPR